MTQTPDLTPVAEVEERTDSVIGTHLTVWVTFPYAGVDRPRTQGMGVTKKNLARLVKAVNAGATVKDAEVLTDVAGNTYVGFTTTVHTRYINVDLKKLGY